MDSDSLSTAPHFTSVADPVILECALLRAAGVDPSRYFGNGPPDDITALLERGQQAMLERIPAFEYESASTHAAVYAVSQGYEVLANLMLFHGCMFEEETLDMLRVGLFFSPFLWDGEARMAWLIEREVQYGETDAIHDWLGRRRARLLATIQALEVAAQRPPLPVLEPRMGLHFGDAMDLL